MDYKLELQNNNMDLQSLIDKANVLPDKVTLDAEIIAQEEKLSTQDTLIASMMAALEGKVAGNSSNTKTIYLDWSEDAELINEIVYLNAQGQFITVEAFDNITSIEAEYGIVFVRKIDSGTWWTNGLEDTNILTSSYYILQTTQNGETIYLVASG